MENLCAFHRITNLTILALLLVFNPSHAEKVRITTYVSGDSLSGKAPTRSSGNKEWEHLWKFGVTKEVTLPISDDGKILGWLPKVPAPDLHSLKNKLGLPQFKLMAIGGSLPSGVRNGGLFREAQLTAYPNLIARQMAVSFSQPLFSLSEANGSGYKVLTSTEGGVFQYDLVTNNLAFDKKSADQNLSKSQGSFDNLAMPFLNIRSPWKTMEYYAQHGGKFDEASTDFVRYFRRIMSESDFSDPKLNYLDFLRSKPSPDFVIYDLGMDGHLKEAMIGGYVSQLPIASEGERGGRIEFAFLKELNKIGAKGVVVTIPDVLDFPYFKMYSLENLRQYSETVDVAVEQNNGVIRPANHSDIFLPSEGVITLFREKKNTVLSETEVIAINSDLDESQPFRSVNWYNDYYVKYTAKENGWAVFDLYDLYKKITSGNYVTHDGVKVDPSFPDGNFYSSDGIHPSAFGQAVIANECITAINSHYGASIEKLPTAGFLKVNR